MNQQEKDITTTSHFSNAKVCQRRHISHLANSAKLLLDQVFEQYSRILAIRVDFGYKSEYQSQPHEQLCDDRKRYLHSRRDCHIFDGLVDVMWKLEYQSSFHYHTLWLFNGHERHQHAHAYIAHQLCERWVKMTQGRGIAYNCNQHINDYKDIGIGMVHRDDLAKRESLLNVAMYLCKEDKLVKSMIPKGYRTFGRSIVR